MKCNNNTNTTTATLNNKKEKKALKMRNGKRLNKILMI